MSTYASPRSPASYQEAAVLTAPPGQLVVMLYDGARRFLFQAAALMREERFSDAGARIRRAELIVDELLCTLNMEAGGEVAANLQGLYVFFVAQLSEARMERDADKLDWVNAQLGELREAWSQISATTAAA